MSAPDLSAILAIPGNRPVFDSLTELMCEKKAVAFVGAGASAGMYPMWGAFIDQLADYAVKEGKAEPKDAERWKKDKTSTPQQRVNIILRKLEEPLYRQFLKSVFGPARGPDSKRFTSSHAALLRLPFQGYVTTNYDPGLEFARAEIRPEILTTGTPTWQDTDEVYLWRTGDIFKRECPILWLHGYWQRPDGIVLNSGEYSQAYKPGIYRETFKELWLRERLLFLGFGFNDPQFTFMVGEFLREIEDANAAPRHIAILSWPMPEDGSAPDPEEIAEKRENLGADYHLRVIFYPVTNHDHSALQTLLAGIANGCRCAIEGQRPSVAPVAASTASAPKLHQKWVHETSNDDKFTGREEELETLDRWMRDDAVKVIGITAVGGTGKTALLGHWLKNTTNWQSRGFQGLFAWSFYQNRDAKDFLRELLLWAYKTFGSKKPDDKTDLVKAAVQRVCDYPLLLALDGLEVIQEASEGVKYGTLLDVALRDLLHAVCEEPACRSRAALTSRFVFSDLERHIGTSFHAIELHGLPKAHGEKLLSEMGISGSKSDREEISKRLEGHPLALRVFAEALPDADRKHPLRFLDHAFRPNEMPAGTPLNDRLRRLLKFYEQKLSPDQVRLLEVVALFRSPVNEETILRLARGTFGPDDSNSPLSDEIELHRALSLLHNRGILSREPIDDGHGYACHPILRDHFRSVFVSSGSEAAHRAADLLTGAPSSKPPQNLKEIEPALLAIELLLDAGDFHGADLLYSTRLENGSVFARIPANFEGFRTALGFVKSHKHEKICEEKLSRRKLAYFLNAVGISARACGYLISLYYYQKSISISRDLGDNIYLCAELLNLARASISFGRLTEAGIASDEALRLLSDLKTHPDEVGRGESVRAWQKLLSGQLRQAACGFSRDAAIRHELFVWDGAHGVSQTWAIELLLRCGHVRRALRQIQSLLKTSQDNGWFNHVGRCHAFIASCALAEGRLADAGKALEKAEPIFRRGSLVYEMAGLHIIAGKVAQAQNDSVEALHRANAALSLAQTHSMRLVHADALVLRGQTWMLDKQGDRAMRSLDDAAEALRIARECGYTWAEREALLLESEARTVLVHQFRDSEPRRAERDSEAAQKALVEAEALAKKLTLTEGELDAADREAEAWFRAWKTGAVDSEMDYPM